MALTRDEVEDLIDSGELDTAVDTVVPAVHKPPWSDGAEASGMLVP